MSGGGFVGPAGARAVGAAPAPVADSATFLAAVGLKEVAPEVYDLAYEATTQHCPWPKAYGGDLVAQALAATQRTVDDARSVHSIHGYFLRPAEIGEAVRYEVEIVRDGRGYSTRSVRGFQRGRAVFSAQVSFQVPEDSPLAFPAPGLPDVPAPEDLPPSSAVLAGVDTMAARYWAAGRGFDMRHVPDALYLEGDRERAGAQYVWVRAFDRLDDDANLHQTALAYVCDYTILESALRAHGLSWSTPGLVTASVDHAMWFHRPGRMDDWVLYAQEAVSAQTGRGLGLGRFYTRDGELLATVAQEGVVRPV